MATLRGMPRRRGRPAKAVRLARGAILSKPVQTRDSPSTRGKRASQLFTNGGVGQKDSDSVLNLGDELDRWKELKERQDLETDEEMARFLLDSWETKETRKENQIQVGMATVRDFENFKTRTKKSSDEVIRFFLRLDIEPGLNVISVSDEVGKTFDILKSSLKMGANDLMKHLFDVREKFLKKPDENKGNYLSGIEKRVRDAVREEMVQLMSDGVLSTNPSTSMQREDKIHVKSGVSPNKREAAMVIDQSPDGGKKRPRKSLPQRVVIEQDDLSDSDNEGSVSVSSVSWELDASNTGVVEDSEVMQYNYVINPTQTFVPVNASTPVTLVGNPQVSWTGLSTSTAIIQQGAGTQVIGTPLTQGTLSDKELEAKGFFKVGAFTIMKEANGLLSCPHCDYKGTSVVRLRRHFTLHTGKAYKCSMCDRSYTEEYKLKEHFQVKHEKSVHFKCQLCDREFTSKGGLKYHTRTVHRKDFAYWCEGCCKGFNYLQFYQAHMNKHNGPAQYKCNVCSKEFTYLATLSMHRKSCVGGGQINSLACEMCGETFMNDKDLKEHTITEHCDVSRFRCICGVEFRWRAGLDNHKAKCSDVLAQKKKLQEVDGLSNMMIVNVESLSNKKQISPLLSKSEEDMNKSTNVDFDENSSDSIEITNVESGERFVCDITGDDDDNNSQVSPAAAVMHTCQFCDYKTQKSSHMKRHELTHTGKKYKCHDCPKSFNELTKLRTHQNSKHQGQARYKCDKCSRTFSSKGGIMYHQQTKHNNSYKYRCETCDKGFNTIQHYLGHKNTHTGIRPYVCEKCNVGFSYPSVLTSHKRVCKGKVDGLSTGGLDLYPCKECKEKFALPSSLQQHVREMHSSTLNSKYMCDCGEEFELHALYELHKSRCSKSDKSSEMILQTVSVEADSTENTTNGDDEEFKQLSPEKFNAILCNQPVFPS
ncbi:zinc finger protein 729-like [Mercenaria mercenaria]|uniref:zinc finger protein 729-like n=1 Tax=Mercenaria mercenaria TaxID=6596 RepID=UPI00234E4C1B|nr:zinc finger protein 729-like [Mercenaria mercenaria]